MLGMAWRNGTAEATWGAGGPSVGREALCRIIWHVVQMNVASTARGVCSRPCVTVAGRLWRKSESW